MPRAPRRRKRDGGPVASLQWPAECAEVRILAYAMPDGEWDYRNAIEGYGAHRCLRDLDEWLRHKLKYEELPDGAGAVYEAVRERLHALLQDYEVTLDR